MKKFLIVDGFAIAYLIALELTYQSGDSINRTTFLWLGLIFAALAVLTFFYAGSRHILFASVFSYGQLLFVAFPAIMIGLGQTELRAYLNSSATLQFLSLCFVVQIILFTWSQPVAKSVPKKLEVGASYQILALVFSATAFLLSYGESAYGLASHLESLSLGAIVLSSLVTFTRPSLKSAIPHAICLSVITSVYALYGFSGLGRLVLASYLLSIGVVFSWVNRSYVSKVIAMVSTVPGLIVLALSRVSYVEAMQGREIGIEGGLGSVLGPFQSGSYIFQQSMDGAIGPTFGESYLTSLLFWIPRELWEDKPVGFGRAIVPITRPDQVSSSIFSDAAPYLAEYFWDLGVIGLLLGPLLVLLLVSADRWIVTNLLTADWTQTFRSPVLLAASLAALVSMLLNYVWGGSFPYLSRTLIPSLLLFGLYVTSGVVPKRRSGRRDQSERVAARVKLRPRHKYGAALNYWDSEVKQR